MTIALGVLASDGIILASDSEQTWSYLKTSGAKVTGKTFNGSIAITGSGTYGYLEGLGQKVSAIFIDNPDAGLADLEAAFERVLSSFFADHVIPFAQFANPPYCDLIIGVERNGDRALWASTHASLRRCDSYASTGIGAEYATEVLAATLNPKNIKPSRIDAAMAERIAIYTVWLVKQRVQGCGKDTQVATIKKGEIAYCPLGRSLFLESFFHNFSELQAFCFHYVNGYPFPNDEEALKRLTANLGFMKERICGLDQVSFIDVPWGMEPLESD